MCYLKKLANFEVINIDDIAAKYPNFTNPDGGLNWFFFEKEIRPKYFIYYRPDKNSLSFTIQNGPIKEVGVNGCQVDSIIDAALQIISYFDDQNPCEENKNAVYHLKKALEFLEERKKQREINKTEGTSK